MSAQSAPNPASASPAAVPHAPPVRRLALLIFLLSPLLVLALLVVLIYRAQQAGPKMNERPIGAGAGETGMARPPIRLDK